MIELLARQWWLVVLRGVLAILFGVVAIAFPVITLIVLALLWGIYALVDGVMALVLAFTSHTTDTARRWLLGLFGVVGILAGIFAIGWPGITALALLLIIAFWALVGGVLQVATAIRLRRTIRNERFLLITGLLTIVLGILLLVRPAAGALALVTVIAIFAILWGISLILFGVRLHRVYREAHAAV